jgi:hypothetical protein
LIRATLILLLLAAPSFAGWTSDSSDDFNSAGSPATLDQIWPTNGGSVCGWVSLPSITNDAATILAKGGSWGIYFYDDAGINPILGFYRDYSTTDGEWSAQVTGDISANTPFHLCLVYDQDLTTNVPAIYVNGVAEAVTTDTTPVGSPNSDAANNMTVSIASDPNDFTMHDLAVWKNISLTASEVLQMASARTRFMPLQIQPAALVGYWTFDQQSGAGTGRAYRDFSGNGNTFTDDDGANNTGSTANGDSLLSYP